MFASPWALLLLLLPIGLGGAYLWALKHPQDTIEWSNAAAVQKMTIPGRLVVRRVGAVLLLVGMVVCVLGAARPYYSQNISAGCNTVVLALDTSASMGVDDIKPTRLAGVQSAGVAAVQQAPADLCIGLVSLSGNASLVLAPTRDHQAVVNAIQALTVQPYNGTAIGEGVVTAIGALNTVQGYGGTENNFTGSIFLLSDGVEQPVPGRRSLPDAAKLAKEDGFSIYAVNFATEEGGFINGQRVGSDPDVLTAAATTTGGQFINTTSTQELNSAFQKVQQISAVQQLKTATPPLITWVVCGLLLLLIAGGFTLLLIYDDRR